MPNITRKLAKLITIVSLRAPYFSAQQKFNVAKVALLAKKLEVALDLGSGPVPTNEFGAKKTYGLDIRENLANSVRRADLNYEPFPYDSNSFDLITAYDFLEHISRVAQKDGQTIFPVVNLMNEIWRTLKVGGIFFSNTPCFPMKEAFQDPTHVNIMSEDTLKLYFGTTAWAGIYGYHGRLKVLEEGWRGGHYFCFMEKVSEEKLFHRTQATH